LWQTTLKKKVEIEPKYLDELEEENINKILNEGNPNHAPSGDSKGGQFTKGDGAGSGDDDKKDEPKKDISPPSNVKYVNSNNRNFKSLGKYKKMTGVQNFINKSFDNIPTHLAIMAGGQDIIITDKPSMTQPKGSSVVGTFQHSTKDIRIRPSNDVDYNTNLITHELAHKWDEEKLNDENRKKWNESDIMKQPITEYTQEILTKHGDKKVRDDKMGNTFRVEQFAELQRMIFAPPTKFMGGKKLVDDKTFQKQREFFFELTSVWKPEDPRNPFVKKESKCPDCGEDVALSGDHSRADIDKKKKKIAKVPRGFEFKEAIDEHWESLIQEVRFKAFTHSSSFVGNVKYDQDNQSMEIILNGSTYDFCNVSERLYDSFEGANSKGAFFNREIKTLHDC